MGPEIYVEAEIPHKEIPKIEPKPPLYQPPPKPQRENSPNPDPKPPNDDPSDEIRQNEEPIYAMTPKIPSDVEPRNKPP